MATWIATSHTGQDSERPMSLAQCIMGLSALQSLPVPASPAHTGSLVLAFSPALSLPPPSCPWHACCKVLRTWGGNTQQGPQMHTLWSPPSHEDFCFPALQCLSMVVWLQAVMSGAGQSPWPCSVPSRALTPPAVTKHSSQPVRGLDVLFSWSAKAVHAAIDLRDNITCFQVYEAINSPAY